MCARVQESRDAFQKKFMDESIERLTDVLLSPGRAESYPAVFRKLGFADPQKASSLWKKLLPPLGVSGQAADHATSLIDELAGCPHPDMALLNLSRFMDALIAPSHFLSSLFLERPLCHLLVIVFSCSYYLADILIRNPGYLSWLIERDTLERPKSFSTYREELHRQVTPFKEHHRRLNSIKRYKRREILRIGTRDLLGLSLVEEVTAELSFLADAVIDIVAEMVFEDESRLAGLGDIRLDREAGGSLHRFSIISMGKLGGSELNYSSDIDLLYICEAMAGTDEESFYAALARRITNNLSSPTEEGTLYRVDLRLRPDGETGPLVVTVHEHLNYMMRRARPWEKQALLKARYTAGHRPVAEAFLANCHGVVFNPIVISDPLNDILTMRERTIKHLPPPGRERNIKLMSGGIRDLEFIAQALELTHGRGRPEVRSRNTLESFERLHHFGLLSDDVTEILGRCYRLFRTVEHRLQMIQNVRTHTLPTGERELSRLGARVAHSALDMPSGEGFRSELSRSIRQVRRVFDAFFKDRRPGEIPLLLSLPPGEKEVERILSSYGIKEGERAHRFLSSLVYGDFPHLESPETVLAAEQSLPKILENVSLTPDPLLTLKNLVRIVRATGAIRSTLELLSESDDLLRLLLVIAALSTILTSTISERVELLDVLAEGIPPGDPPTGSGDLKDRLTRLARWYEESLLYIHCQKPIPENGPEILGPLLSEAAEGALVKLFELSGGTEEQVALLALGSLGSRECRFRSDFDLVAILHDSGNTERAAGAMRRLIEYGREVHIGSIDLRLRGEGDISPLVQTLQSYQRYFETRAALWEMLAFSKCRLICGDQDTGNAFQEILKKRLSRKRLLPGWKDEFTTMREKLESLSDSPWDVKHAAGGLYDIDFIAASARLDTYLKKDTVLDLTGALERLRAEGFLEASEIASLAHAHKVFYLIEHAAALHGLAYPPLPQRETFFDNYMNRLLADLIPGDGDFIGKLNGLKSTVRGIFDRFVKRLK